VFVTKLQIPEMDKLEFKKYLEELNIKWWVCVHSRTKNCRIGVHTNDGENIRNCDINSYELAMKEIIRLGGHIILVGDEGNIPKYNHENIINMLGDNGIDEQKLEVNFVEGCKFFLGCDSGPAQLAKFFGRPVIYTNVTNKEEYFVGKNDLIIRKKIVDGKYVDNTTEEILKLVNILLKNG
jgi:putative glycosyltransferase (TIGR04372 family)